jgi:preprotein translocase subunit YajC
MLNLISHALAQENVNDNVTSNGFSLVNFVPFALVFVVFYFLIIRPQHKKMQQHKQMLDSLKIGDKVITSGGIVGKIKNIQEQEITLEIAQNTEIIVLKDYILQPKEKISVTSAQQKKNLKNKKNINIKK